PRPGPQRPADAARPDRGRRGPGRRGPRHAPGHEHRPRRLPHPPSPPPAPPTSPRDVLSRLETMVLMAGVDIPLRAIREQISSAINLIVHQARLKDGTRRLTHVTEIVGIEGDVITLQHI